MRSRAIVGACMLGALVLSAFAAQNAAAATKGTTAFTCVKEKGSLRGEHCLTTGGGASEYGHVEIAEGTTTEIIGTNGKTATETTAAGLTRLKMTVAGVAFELTATQVSASGLIRNSKDVTGEHYVEGTLTIVFEGVTVSKPAGKGCKVFLNEGEIVEGEVDTKLLKATTTGQGDNLKLEPAIETTLATFFIKCGGGLEGLGGTWTITGSLSCPVTGATITCSHEAVTTANTLKVKGSKAGLEGSLTISGRALASGAYTPLSPTTVETP